MTILDQVDKVVVLNVDRRIQNQPRFKDFLLPRLKHDNLEFFVVGKGKILPEDEYNMIDGKYPPMTWRGFYNSYFAHLAFQEIIRRAKLNNIQNLLILEDDAEFTDQFDEVNERANVPAYGALYLGANHTWALTQEVNEYVLKLNGSLCWHAVVLNNSVFDEIIRWQPTEPIDGKAAKILHKKYDCYALWPSVVVQEPGFSMVEGRMRDYSEFWSNKGC